MLRKRPPKSRQRHLAFEQLEQRTVPALVASQLALNPPVLTPDLVQKALDAASKATASNDGIIAVVDREGNILGVHVEGGVSPSITGSTATLDFAVDGAVALARTGAFFANDTAPLTSRTIQEISQSTITQQEVQSNPSITDPNSPLRGPGFVAPVGDGGHFPPGVQFTPEVDLFGIENTNRDSLLNPGPDGIEGTSDDIPLTGRFNIDPTYVPPGQALTPPFSYGDTILPAADRTNPNIPHDQSRGIGTLPGGIPIYEGGTLVGGIGVFFPGTTGYATEENSSLSSDYDPTKPDRSLEAEFDALQGSQAVGAIPVIGAGRIDLAGITLNTIGPGGTQGIPYLTSYAEANLGVGQGTLAGGKDLPIDAAGDTLSTGVQVPQGWLVTPHDGVGITAAQVTQIIEQGIAEANATRAQIRLPLGERTRMVFAVTDSTGAVLGLYRMPDATVFSIDVAVAKARNTSYYNDPTQLQPEDQVPGVPKGTAFTNRTFRFLADPRFPDGIDGTPPAPFSILNTPGVNPVNAQNVHGPQPASVYDSNVLGYDAFHPNTNFHQPTDLANQNGVVFFPGSSGVYVSGTLRGGFGVSGDGVDQDDFITQGGIAGFDAPNNLRADYQFFQSVRLPYLKYPRNPLD